MGAGTFHGMGIIATITPGTTISKPVPNKVVTVEDIRHCHDPREEASPLYYKELQSLGVQDTSANLDLLWKLTQPLLRSQRPAWSGTMQKICEGDYPGRASIMFLPMIDLDPSNKTCIYSTLLFVSEQAKRYHVTPVITFDQPLWFKALMIVRSEPKA